MRLRAIQNNVDTDKSVLEYPDFLLKLGKGKLKTTRNTLIYLTTTAKIRSSTTELVRSVFQNLAFKYNDVQWLKTRAILTPKNSRLQMLNNQVSEWFPGKFSDYKSAEYVLCDSVEAQNAPELRYPQVLLNSIEAEASLPDYETARKKDSIFMLLRNIKPSSGHVSGTKYVVENMTSNLLFLTSASESKKVRLLNFT